MKFVPMIGSPPMPMHVDWPIPGTGELMDDLVGERPAARHDPDLPLPADLARDDPHLGTARGDGAGAVRPDQARRRAHAGTA